MALRQISLPPSRNKSGMSLVEALARRESIRDYGTKPLSPEQVSQLLWATQGITDGSQERRAVPSAGATYPLEIIVVCGDVEGINTGIYRYNVESHSLTLLQEGDFRSQLGQAALGQNFIYEAPLSIVICAIYERTAQVYGARAKRYVHIEVGHAGQNVYLQATALGLGTVAVGAFSDEQVRGVLKLDKRYSPLYIMPIGYPARR